jgi:hypothetical protein
MGPHGLSAPLSEFNLNTQAAGTEYTCTTIQLPPRLNTSPEIFQADSRNACMSYGICQHPNSSYGNKYGQKVCCLGMARGLLRICGGEDVAGASRLFAPIPQETYCRQRASPYA